MCVYRLTMPISQNHTLRFYLLKRLNSPIIFHHLLAVIRSLSPCLFIWFPAQTTTTTTTISIAKSHQTFRTRDIILAPHSHLAFVYFSFSANDTFYGNWIEDCILSQLSLSLTITRLRIYPSSLCGHCIRLFFVRSLCPQGTALFKLQMCILNRAGDVLNLHCLLMISLCCLLILFVWPFFSESLLRFELQPTLIVFATIDFWNSSLLLHLIQYYDCTECTERESTYVICLRYLYFHFWHTSNSLQPYHNAGKFLHKTKMIKMHFI